MAKPGNSIDSAHALGVFGAVAFGLMGYGAGGAPGAVMGAATGYGVGRLAARFFDSLKIVIANIAVMALAGLLIFVRVSLMEKRLGAPEEQKGVPGPERAVETEDARRMDKAVDYANGLFRAKPITVSNTCPHEVEYYLRWQDEDSHWIIMSGKIGKGFDISVPGYTRQASYGPQFHLIQTATATIFCYGRIPELDREWKGPFGFELEGRTLPMRKAVLKPDGDSWDWLNFDCDGVSKTVPISPG